MAGKEGPILSLRIYPDEVLRSKADPITVFDDRLRDLVDEMGHLMRASSGIGLAAPQVGILERLFIIEFQGETKCLVNPVIRRRHGSGDLVEGCLSLPDIHVQVSRPQRVEVDAYDEFGARTHLELSELFAHVVQHELDHLNGVLIIDYAGPIRDLKAADIRGVHGDS